MSASVESVSNPILFTPETCRIMSSIDKVFFSFVIFDLDIFLALSAIDSVALLLFISSFGDGLNFVVFSKLQCSIDDFVSFLWLVVWGTFPIHSSALNDSLSLLSLNVETKDGSFSGNKIVFNKMFQRKQFENCIFLKTIIHLKMFPKNSIYFLLQIHLQMHQIYFLPVRKIWSYSH